MGSKPLHNAPSLREGLIMMLCRNLAHRVGRISPLNVELEGQEDGPPTPHKSRLQRFRDWKFKPMGLDPTPELVAVSIGGTSLAVPLLLMTCGLHEGATLQHFSCREAKCLPSFLWVKIHCPALCSILCARRQDEPGHSDSELLPKGRLVVRSSWGERMHDSQCSPFASWATSLGNQRTSVMASCSSQHATEGRQGMRSKAAHDRRWTHLRRLQGCPG